MPTPTKYTYSISGDFPDGEVDSDLLAFQIQGSSIATALLRIDTDTAADACDIWFVDVLSGGDHTTLNGIVAAHSIPTSVALSDTLTLRQAFSAGGSQDVVIYNANAPRNLRLIDAKLLISTAVLLSTAQLRNATGGGGSAIFSAFTTAVTGVIPLTATATATVSAGDTLVLRRSNNGVAGEIVLTFIAA